jgi:putative aldouronate transport system substrate-binding protein
MWYNKEWVKKLGLEIPANTDEFYKFLKAMYEEPEVIEQRALIEAELVPYLQNFIAKSIVNGITDTDWKAHLENLKKLKADEYVASYQAKYDAGKKVI